MTTRHPMQPIEIADGVARFRPNSVVQRLLESSPYSLDELEYLHFSDEDREQFAQLLGIPVADYVELPFVSERSSHEAQLAEDELNPSNPYAHELSWVDETNASCDPSAAPKRNAFDKLSKAVADFLIDMGHDGCTPRGGCPIAALREAHRQLTIETLIVPDPSTGTSSAPMTVFVDDASALKTSG